MGTDRIASIKLDERSIVRWTPEIEHERNVAVFDLLEENSFDLKGGPAGPYDVVLSLREANVVLAIEGADAGAAEVVLSARPMRRVIKDYFMICESYFDAIKGASPSRIEAIDMARRGLHNEGSDILQEALNGKVEMDQNTARRLFTLVCVLHLRA